MAKNNLLIGFFTFLTFSLFGQINSPDFGARRAPCFQKSLDRMGQKYVEWECGNDNSLVDCNEALEGDPGSNVVYTRSGGSPFTGTCETCHMNGLRQNLISFSNGRVEGIDTTYYESGCPQVVRNHISGKENGTWTYYQDSSGLVAWEIGFAAGEKHGKSTFFRQRMVGTDRLKIHINGADRFIDYGVYENDTVKVEHYVDGVLEGVKKEYYFPGSKVMREVNYRQGVFHGAYLEYNPEGELLQELTYFNGLKDGDWKFFYDDGSLMRTESWNKDVKEGEFKTFFINGEIQSIEVYRKGQENGEFIERFHDNKLKRQAIYRRGVLIEEHVFDKWGNEIKTVGGSANQNAEDDDIPTTGKQKKAKKPKKEKKSKK